MVPRHGEHGADPPEPVTDHDLLNLVSVGDTLAFRSLYARYAGRAHTVAARVCLDHGLAEAVVQEVFLMLWRDSSRYTPTRGTFASWLFTIVHNRAVDAVRHERAARRRSMRGADANDPPGPGADEAALESILAEQVRAALSQLPGAQRQTLLLAYYGGYTQREISEFFDIPLGTVQSRMFAGVQRLRTLLRPSVDPPAPS